VLRLVLLIALPLLAACGNEVHWNSPELVARAKYPNGAETTITLLTVVHSRTGNGDHSALLISGSHRVIYDPAGTFAIPEIARRGDVLYGISPGVETVYLGYHARDSHHVVAQTLSVTPAQAEAAIAAAERKLPAGPGLCAARTSAVLRAVPGLEGVGATVFPRSLSERFGAIPGVESRTIVVDDIPVAARTRFADPAVARRGG
jgi:hypothetical protein